MIRLQDQPVIGIVPGFGSGRGSYQPLVSQLQAEGHKVVFFPSVRFKRMPRTPKGYPQALARQAQAIAQAARKANIKKLVLIGHSMGGPVAAITAVLAPELVQRVIFVCSAGLYPDTFVGLGRRLLQKSKADTQYAKLHGNEAKAMLKMIRWEAARYVANPVRAFAEGWALARFSVLKLYSRNGFDCFYLYGEYDPLFELLQLEPTLRHYVVPGVRHCVKGIGHDPQNKPDEARRLVEAMKKHRLLSPP